MFLVRYFKVSLIWQFIQLKILIVLFLNSWFHPNLNRHHAEALLIQNGEDGSYLLRASSSNVGEYSLSVRCANSVKHFQIGWDGSHYTFGMGRFSSLKDFVEHFENKPLIGGQSGKQYFVLLNPFYE